MRGWTWPQWLTALSASALVAALIGVPSALLPNSWYLRMTPAPWWSYAAWVASAVLTGLLVATYIPRAGLGSPAPSPSASASSARVGVGANIAAFLAVGCPVCNKLVVAAVGASGALSWWAPLQPLVAGVSVMLLGWALWRRLSPPRVCPVPPAAAVSPAGEDMHVVLNSGAVGHFGDPGGSRELR